MSDDTILGAPDGADPDMAAAELALGLLEGDERAAALRRVLAEPGFAQDVEAWRGHLAQMFAAWPEMTAPGAVLGRVERSIDLPAVAPVAARTSRVWPIATALASALAAMLLAVIVLRPAPPAPRPAPVSKAALPSTMLVAAIDPVTAGSTVGAVYDPASGALRLSAAALAETDRSAELWIIGSDGTPHSLGVLPVGRASGVTVTPANRAQIAAGATLAVTLEAIGGSPTGKPQGPIVAKGTLSQV